MNYLLLFLNRHVQSLDAIFAVAVQAQNHERSERSKETRYKYARLETFFAFLGGKIREKWQARQSRDAVGRWERQGKVVSRQAAVFSRQNDNSGRRRRDESNWRKEGPDTARREEPKKNGTRRGTRNAKWQEGIGCAGTNETTHN
ncbi:hypothetical protein K0M31_003395 [Melipona bicolor]|uniref:Uncharacterized protein n=1 Tax=Melipona bicolor TaxID=60889 RepID=A0AA40KPE8_9HYME|nr:hypothetical protein K0M31_003395 [Melipona bicolor]